MLCSNVSDPVLWVRIVSSMNDILYQASHWYHSIAVVLYTTRSGNHLNLNLSLETVTSPPDTVHQPHLTTVIFTVMIHSTASAMCLHCSAVAQSHPGKCNLGSVPAETCKSLVSSEMSTSHKCTSQKLQKGNAQSKKASSSNLACCKVNLNQLLYVLRHTH